MHIFEDYLKVIKDDSNRNIMRNLLDWVMASFPMLDTKIAWNQPHFVHEGTFIIAFTHAKAHLSVAPEYKAIDEFKKEIRARKYLSTNFIFKIKWNQAIDLDLIKKIIEYNMKDKAGYKTYWRKSNLTK